MLYRLMRTMRERTEDSASRRTLEGVQDQHADWASPLVIGGTGGSGTRAVSKVIAHAHVHLGCNLNEDNDSLDMAEFLSHWLPQWVDAGNQDLGGIKQARMDRHFLAALVRLRGQGIKADASWLVKNPRMMYLLPFLNRHFPDFKFLHLIRDGRDMAFSKNQGQLAYLGSKYLGESCDKTNPVQSAKLWAKANLAVKRYGETHLGDRYLQLRFEALCNAPAATAEKIFAFIGVEADTIAAAREIAAPRSVGRWQEQDPALGSEIAKICQEALTAFGYRADHD
jgi:hypothetical protein